MCGPSRKWKPQPCAITNQSGSGTANGCFGGRIGGSTVDEASRRMMAFLFDHPLARKFNYVGRYGKREFRGLRLFEVVYGSLKECPNNPNNQIRHRKGCLKVANRCQGQGRKSFCKGTWRTRWGCWEREDRGAAQFFPPVNCIKALDYNTQSCKCTNVF